MMLKKLINISLRAIIGLLIIVFLYCFIGYLWPSQALPQANHPHPTIILSDPTIVDIENNKLICH
jgi:ABC-type phosphate transport system auxiliary subunit